MVLSPHDIHVSQSLAVFSGVLSVVGAGLLLVSFLVFKELRTYSSRLILFLSISDIGDAIGWILAPEMKHHNTCVTQGVLIQFFALAAIIWQVCIAAYILQVNLGLTGLEKQEIWYHIASWGAPALSIIVGCIYDIYGPAGAWCWVQKPHELTGLGILYIPFVVAILFTSILYIIVGFVVRRKELEAQTESEKIKLYRMRSRLRSRFYLVPFAVGWIFGLINRIHNLISTERVPILFELQATFFPLQGFWNFLMYGLIERIRSPQTIYEILANPMCRKYFGMYMEAQRASENMDFWNDLARLKTIQTGTPEWETTANQIKAEYIVIGAAKEVNIPGFVKDELLNQLTPSGFDKAEKEVVDLMQQNMIYFRASAQHDDMLEELQASEAVGGSVAGRLLIGALYHRIVLIIKGHSMYKKMCASSSVEPLPQP